MITQFKPHLQVVIASCHQIDFGKEILSEMRGISSCDELNLCDGRFALSF